MNYVFHSEVVVRSMSSSSPLWICGIGGFYMLSFWTRRWDSFMDKPFVARVETIFVIGLMV